jgi:3-carboxy-cis,cis-muconate cycloisomerase
MTAVLMPTPLLSPLHASAAMRTIMSERARLQRMLDFEAALARAEAAVGVVTATAAGEIADACRAERYDLVALAEAADQAGDIVIPLINALAIEVSRRNKTAAGFVHWGASGQDVIDTALVLELRAAIDALVVDLDIAVKAFTTLAGRHRRTLAVARTMLQQALPMPFGLKLAGYAAALARSRDRLMRLRREALALQFGGAAGTLAALGEHGFGVAERLAALLDLQLPDAPWHTHRDRLAEVAAAFGILAGTCGKIARDVALMMQTEVAEAFEPEVAGRGGSSTLPHKRNPSAAAAALSAAAIAPNLVATILAAQVQEHERALGGWQTEWMTFPALALVTSGALSAVVEIAEGLEVNVERLRTNLELSGGQIMAEAAAFALAEKTGRAEAHRIMQDLSQRARKEGRPLKDMLLGDLRVKSLFSSVEIEKLFIPLTYQGSAQIFIERLVVASQSRAARRPETRLDLKLPGAAQLQPMAEIESPKVASPDPPAAVGLSQAPPVDAAAAVREESSPEPHIAPEPPEPISPLATAPAPLAATPESPPIPQGETQAPEPASQPAADHPPVETAAAAKSPAPPVAPPPAPDDDAPGAFLEVLSRAEAEAAEAERKRRSQ